MSFIEISVLVVFSALGWLWLDSLKAREIAVTAARNACAADGYLLLDDTAILATTGLPVAFCCWATASSC